MNVIKWLRGITFTWRIMLSLKCKNKKIKYFNDKNKNVSKITCLTLKTISTINRII